MSERASPFSVAVCQLIALHNDPESEFRRSLSDDDAVAVSSLLHSLVLPDEDEEVDVFDVENTHESLASLLSRLPTSASRDALRSSLRASLSSVDGLVDAFDGLAAGVPLVSRDSAQGVYVRRLVLGFEESSFEAVGRLVSACRAWLDGDGDDDDAWPRSSAQTERALQRECARFDDRPAADDSSAAEARLRRILARHPESPSAHLLRALHDARRRERVGATESLHRYFDYASIRERRRPGADGGESRRGPVVRRAAAAAAVLRREFGDERSAAEAAREAVRVAQQDGDADGVARAAGRGDGPNATLREAATTIDLEQSRRALESATVVGAGEEEGGVEGSTRLGAEGGRGRRGRTVAEESSAAASNGGRAHHHHQRAPAVSATAPSRDTLSVAARRHLVASGVWDSLGQSVLGRTAVRAALNERSYLSADERLVAAHKAALSSSCEDEDSSSDVPRDAVSLLRSRDVRRALVPDDPANAVATHHAALAAHRWAVRRGELARADALAPLAHAAAPPDPRERTAEAARRTLVSVAERAAAVGDRERAAALFDRATRLGDAHGDDRTRARTLLDRAATLARDVDDVDAELVPLVLECLSETERLDMDVHHARATTLLAETFLRRDHDEAVPRARALLEACAPVLERDDDDDDEWRGRARTAFAKCCMREAGLVGGDDDDGDAAKDRLEEAIDHLREATAAFANIDSVASLRETHYLTARICHSLPGKRAERNAALKAYRDVCARLAFGATRRVWPDALTTVQTSWGDDERKEVAGGGGGGGGRGRKRATVGVR